MKKITYKKLNRGFTLVEILIAVFVFSIVVTTAAGIFTISANTQVETQIARTLAQDERFVLEKISRDIKNSENNIEFCNNSTCSSICDGDCQTDNLRIKVDGNDKIYSFNGDNLAVNINGGTFEDIVSSDFTLSHANGSTAMFSGYASATLAKKPYVTIQFTIDNTSNNPEMKESEKISQTLKTTIVPRNY
jgi:prepilin-type N-terminal cleavage/methylation domain-containing protein